jgi:hypothetical protein
VGFVRTKTACWACEVTVIVKSNLFALAQPRIAATTKKKGKKKTA